MSEQSKTKYDTLKQPAQSKQMLAYQQIKEDILNNTFPEGTVMVERKLCDIYQVSRSPIRNALQQLTHEGLLSFVPGKGVVVSSFSTEDILPHRCRSAVTDTVKHGKNHLWRRAISMYSLGSEVS